MVAVLEFIFKSAWNFLGVLFLIAWTCAWIGIARGAIRIK